MKRNESLGGFWQPVTGGFEEGDKSLIQSCKREIEEETSIRPIDFIKEYPLVRMYQYLSKEKSGDLWVTEYVFGFEVKTSTVIIIGEEHDEFRWCFFEEAIRLLNYEENKNALITLRGIIDQNYRL